MSADAETLVREIAELRVQYVAEVGEGRRKWPRSIKERAEQLEALGLSAKSVSQRTGIGYETLLQWRYKKRHQFKKKFHELAVATPKLPQVGTVTMPITEPIATKEKIGTVTVTTPDGYRIENVATEITIELLKSLRVQKCF